MSIVYFVSNRRRYIVYKAYCLILTLFFNTAVWGDEGIYEYRLPAQTLNDGLLELASVSGLQIIFTADKVRGLTANALTGKMSIRQALENLLAGTGLGFRFIDGQTVTLIQRDKITIQPPSSEQNSIAKPETVKILQPLTIVAKQAAQYRLKKQLTTRYQPSHGFSSTRTSTAVKNTPQSIHFINHNLLNDQGSLSVTESLRNISGVSTGSSQLTPSFDFTRIRGFPAEQLLDGFTQYYNVGDRESLVNIERIEVLKGSNALLYGGGSGSPAGGLVNIVSKLPVDYPIRELGFKYGSYQYYQPFIDINQPLNDYLGFRLTAEYTDAGSHLNELQTERYNINPTLMFSNNTSRFIMQTKISNWRQADYQGLPAVGSVAGSFSIPAEMYLGAKDMEPSQAKFYALWGSLEHQLNERLFLTVKARYSDSEFDQKTQALFGADGLQADQPFAPPSNWALYNVQLLQQQQELSFVSHLESHFSFANSENKLLLGADYSQFFDQGYIESDLLPVGLIDLSNPQASFPYRKPGAGKNNVFVDNKTYGVYLQLQSRWYDRLDVLMGLRLGYIEIAYNNQSPGFIARADTKVSRYLPRLGLVYQLTDQLSGFISYSEGIRGQPFVNFAGTPEPENSRHLESGIKFDLNSGFSGQFAVYQIDRDNIAITDHSDSAMRSITTGRQRSSGVEIDLNWRVMPGLNVLTSYGYHNTRYLHHDREQLAGQPIPHVPSHAGKFWLNYQFSGEYLAGLSIGTGLYAQSGVYLENTLRRRSDSFYNLDATLNYQKQNFKLGLSLKNLTNQHYFESLNYFGGRFIPSQPVSAYFSCSYQF